MKKEDSLRVLFCTYDASDCVLGLFGKLLMRKGALAWLHDIWTCDAKGSLILNDIFTEN